jgi:hypothetical protein
MTEKIRILFLSANPWTTSRILVDEEAREIFERLQEGPDRDRFELDRHAATRAIDLQRLLMMNEPHIVHFSGHGSKKQKIILGGKPGRGKQVDQDGLVQMFALYKSHVRVVVLNACFTRTLARSLSEVIDYSVGASKGIGDKEGVAFAGAFYRALGFGKSIKAAFESAKAELALTRMPRTKGLDLFVRNGVNENDSFPKADRDLSGAADNSGCGGLYLSTNHSSDHYIQQRESVLNHQKGSERAKRQFPIFETSTTRASELAYKEEFHSCEHVLRQGSSRRKETDTRVSDLLRLGDKLSHSALASLRKAKRVKRTNPNPSEDEIERRSSVSCSHTSVTLKIKVFKVALRDSRCISQMRVPRKDQAGRKRARSVNKRLGDGKRSESESSD